MTYLPEAELIRKGLEKEVVGKRFKSVTVRSPGTVQRHRNRPDFAKVLEGRKIIAVTRRGTRIVLDLDDGSSLVMMLGAEGVLSRETANATAGAQTQVVLTFTTGGSLHLADPIQGAELFVAATEGLDDIPELSPGGIDPLAATFTWQAFGHYLTGRKQPLKVLLQDETFVLGLGELYTDEILWVAGLAGDRLSLSLSSQEIRRLYRALFEVLYEAMKQGGTSEDGEGGYADLEGELGEYGKQLSVHGRAGLPCPRCRRPITLDKVEGLPIYYCDSCQT